ENVPHDAVDAGVGLGDANGERLHAHCPRFSVAKAYSTTPRRPSKPLRGAKNGPSANSVNGPPAAFGRIRLADPPSRRCQRSYAKTVVSMMSTPRTRSTR